MEQAELSYSLSHHEQETSPFVTGVKGVDVVYIYKSGYGFGHQSLRKSIARHSPPIHLSSRPKLAAN